MAHRAANSRVAESPAEVALRAGMADYMVLTGRMRFKRTMPVANRLKK